MMEKTGKEIDSAYLRQIYFECEYNLWDGEECKRLKEKKKKISQKPMFSFMMCTYNDASILNAAINSLIAQEYEDWELVILDNSDKSDEPWTLIQNAMEADGRIRGFRNKQNCGWAKGASECMKHVRGKYVTFLAADDCINKGALTYMRKILAEKEPDILWVSALYVDYKSDGDIKPYQICGNIYKEWDDNSHSYNIYEIMNGIMYNTFYHYMNVDFLRKHNIDFYEPYYADCGGMTKALAMAKHMIATEQTVYFLTMNTSQTRGRYNWGSYDFIFAKQWEVVREVFARENFIDLNAVSYVAQRITNNMIGCVGDMFHYRFCNKYMNPIEKSDEEICEELEALLENRYIQEMLVLSGKHMRERMCEMICPYIMDCEHESWVEDKPILRTLKKLILCMKCGDTKDKLENLFALLMLPENKVFMGFEAFAELLELCSDEIVITYQKEIQKVIETYSHFLEDKSGNAEEDWYVGMIR